MNQSLFCQLDFNNLYIEWSYILRRDSYRKDNLRKKDLGSGRLYIHSHLLLFFCLFRYIRLGWFHYHMLRICLCIFRIYFLERLVFRSILYCIHKNLSFYLLFLLYRLNILLNRRYHIYLKDMTGIKYYHRKIQNCIHKQWNLFCYPLSNSLKI